jgi:amino acid adenylation domain-containing protein
MNTLDEMSTDAGLALLAEQQAWLQAVRDGASWGESGYFLQLDIHGEPDLQRLQTALDNCLQRQSALATALRAVPGYHGLRQFSTSNQTPLPLTVLEVGDCAAQLSQWQARPMNLEQGVFVEALLQRLDIGHWQLVLGVARFAADPSSLAILARELIAAYEQGPRAIDEEQAQFTQYLEWRSEVVLDEDADTARRYWQTHGNNRPAAAPDLPERQRGLLSDTCGQSLSATLDSEILAGLDAIAVEQGRPIETLLQAAWWLLLARISGRESFAGGWRHDARRDYEFFADTVGLFEKTLPLNLSPDMTQPFTAWLNALAAQLEEHVTWQEYYPEQVQTGLTYGFATRTADSRREAGGLGWSPSALSETAPAFELVLNVLLDSNLKASFVRLDFLPLRHGEGAMQHLLDQYQVLLSSIVADSGRAVGQLSLSSEQERAVLLAFNPQPVDFSALGWLPDIIARWAITTPDAVALVADAQGLTYAELDVQVGKVAAVLAARGIGHEAVVAMVLPRSAGQVVCMLASWRVGAAYLPLDPAWPLARRQLIVEQAGAAVLFSEDRDLAETLPVLSFSEALQRGGQLATPEATAVQGSDAAYMLFTSGSTGAPKGVVIEHRQLLNYTAGVSRQLKLDTCRHFALGSSVAADLGNTTLFGALFNGATLHVASDATLQDPQGFADFIQAQQIDCLKIVPSHLSALLDVSQPRLPATLVLGGEALPGSLVQRILQMRPDCRLFNHYGPTETTVGVLVHPVRSADADLPAIPLSQVLPNNQLFILNTEQQLVATGELGELYIGGQQLARGYSNPAFDDQAFIGSPFSTGERLYRSGDLARYRAEGGIQLYGRRDHQVKVRGFRIELAEIEAGLLQLPHVSEAVVLLDQASGEPVAFVVLAPSAPDEAPGLLKAQLAGHLPAAMLPSRIQPVARMPRLGNGKIDRQALQHLEVAAPQQVYVAPRDSLEQLVASRMAQLLGQQTLSVDQDFFDAGGHSLLVIKLVAGIRKLLQCEVQPGVVFDNPTPAGLAQALRSLETTPGQLEKIARTRLQLDAMSPEDKARMLEAARQGA